MNREYLILAVSLIIDRLTTIYIIAERGVNIELNFLIRYTYPYGLFILTLFGLWLGYFLLKRRRIYFRVFIIPITIVAIINVLQIILYKI